MADTRRYCAYILRGWLETAGPGDQPAVWRFRLRDVQTGEERAFASLDAATDFLQAALHPDAEYDVEDASYHQDNRKSGHNQTEEP